MRFHCLVAMSGALAFNAFATGTSVPVPEPAPGCGAFFVKEGLDTGDFFRAAIDAMTAHVAILDDNGHIIAVNKAWVQFGRKNGLSSANSAMGEDYPAICERSAAGDSASEGAGVARWIRATLSGGREEFELIYPCDGPDARRWFHLQGSSFESQARRYIILSHHDITRRMVLAEELHTLGRAQAVAGILSGFTHDVNNVLTTLAGYAALARAAAPPGALADHVEAVVNNTDLIVSMVQRLSQLGPRPIRSATPIAAKGAVEHVLDTMAGLPARVTLTRDLSSGVGDLPLAQVDVHLVLNELIKNAVASMPAGGGRIRVSLERGAYPTERLPAGMAHSKTGYLRIVVEDNGPGIPAPMVPRLFDPFFRRHSMDARVGLGLAIVHSVVTGAGGGVSLETVWGKGTAVALYFPASAREGAAGGQPTAAATTEKAGYLLVVDDNDAVLTFTRMGLESMGFKVRTARSVTEAKTLLTAEISLLLTDYAMPDGGGFALAAFAHARRPQIPVIVYSGEADFLARPESVKALVGKPFKLPELKRLIDRLIAGGSGPE